MQLNLEQLSALERIQNGGNYFITGKSGAGKTTLIKALAELPNVIFCAPTGSAARLIGGQTVHRMFQIPPYPVVDANMLPPLARLKRKLLKQVETVVIDEVSMLRGDILRAVDHRLRQCAKSFEDAQKPFGGKNMVFVGDFFQLPPVANGVSSGKHDLDKVHEEKGFYAFQTAVWQEADIKPVYLKKIMRQTDSEFIRILNVLRTNEEEEIPKVLEKLNSRVTNTIPEQAVYLCSTKRIAAARNAVKFAELNGAVQTFTAHISGQFNPQEYPNELELQLKIGQRVISTANSKEVCNGDIGTIYDFSGEGVIVQFDSGIKTELLPVETSQYACKVEKDEDGEEKIIVFKSGSFTQLPLIPGYAITIHRSQGMTLSSVVLDIGSGCFASGQLYVAISRCKSLEALLLLQEISEDDIFIDSDIVEEEIFWKVDAGLIHETLWKELEKLDGGQLDMLSFSGNYATAFLSFFIANYLDAFDADGNADYKELPEDESLIYYEEKIYQHSCNLYLNRPVDIADAMAALKQLVMKFYKFKNKTDNYYM